MGRITVTENVTLDGVMQAPGHPDEDTRGDFALGGWAAPYADAVLMEESGQGMNATGAMLFGRLTYERFSAYWAQQTDGNPFTTFMNGIDKYVASRTLAAPLPWQNSHLLAGEATDRFGRVAQLRDEVEGDVAIIGSGALVRSLEAAGLVDAYHLNIHPLVLGAGTRMFAERAPRRPLRLTASVTTPSGVIMATYEPTETQ